MLRIYDASSLATLKKLNDPNLEFLVPLMQQGVQHFIKNVTTQLYVLDYEGLFIPFTINNKEYSNSYVVSNYYPIASLCDRHSAHPLRHALAQMAGLGLKAIQINKVLTLSNWLLTANPVPCLALEDLKKVTSFLAKRFPEHMISVRTLRQADQGAYGETGYHFFSVREVYTYDGKLKDELPSRALYHRRRDLRLRDKFECVHSIPSGDLGQILELYQKIYINKHTHHSPWYSPEFLELALSNQIIHLTAIQREGRYQGVYASWRRDGKMAVPFFGYDVDAPFHQETYCLLLALILEEADHHGLWLNDGTGGDFAKRVRGFVKEPEYAALYTNHLPTHRRLFWRCADYFMTSPTKKR